jgi:hypothetical protein
MDWGKTSEVVATAQRIRRPRKVRAKRNRLAYGEASMIPTLSEADVARVLKYEALIPAMEKALAAFSTGRVIQPVRNMLTIEEGQRFLGIMPAVTDDCGPSNPPSASPP